MSNYTKSTNFATKDNLTPGDPLKIVRGTEIDTEYNNIATAIATKTDNASAAITGGSITGITDLAVADGGTGASTAAGGLNNLLPTQTGNANKYLQTDGTNATWDAVTLSTADITGTLPVANGGTGVTSSTGTGSVVLSNSPTLVTPALGTPASGVATNLTGLPISTGVSGLGTGVATFLGTPSSANLASAVTDETGSGALVFSNSPTLVTPTLGTPASATLTNATGLPISTGVSGLGTGVATFLATPSSANLATAVSDETGSGALVFANSPTLVTPILGTPTSATLTNATGLPIATGVSGLGTGVATALAVNVGSSGAPLVNGGVLGTPSSGTATNLTGLPLTTGVTGTLPTANGGTNLTSFTSGGVVYASSTSALATGSALTWSGTSLGLTGTTSTINNVLTATTAATYTQYSNSGNNLYIGKENSTGGSFGTTAYASVFYEGGNNPMVFFTSAAEKLRITSSGDVGIGTSSPSSYGTKLAVSGAANVYGDERKVLAVIDTTSLAAGVGAGVSFFGVSESGGGVSQFGSIKGIKENATSGNYAGALAFVTSNSANAQTERMRITSGGSLVVGGTEVVTNNGGVTATTTSSGAITNALAMRNAGTGNGTGTVLSFRGQTNTGAENDYAYLSMVADNTTSLTGSIRFSTANGAGAPAERARITAAGDFIVGRTTLPTWNDSNGFGFAFDRTFKTTFFVQDNPTSYACTYFNATSYTSGTAYFAQFRVNGATVGEITSNGSSTSYVTSSDYRLKNTIAPMTGALAKVALLKPCTYKWNVNGSDGEGFIAHELAEVCPQAVTGEKDAVDADGNIKSQGIDTSFLVATLTAAIQEQQAIIESLKARLDAANL